MIAANGQGYLQQGLGAADLFAALYFSELRLDPGDPSWSDRDRFILSTAHNTAVFYAALVERGCLPPAILAQYCGDGFAAEINASERLGPVVEATCGSLGQGLSVGVGMALSARRLGMPTRVYVVLGDGELQEGQVWEAAISAAQHKLDNLCAIVDFNDMQVDGRTSQIMGSKSVAQRWQAFEWNTIMLDGHSFGEVLRGLDAARACAGRPTCLVAKTVVGKGVPSLEGIIAHNMHLPPALLDKLMLELAAHETCQ